MSWFDIGGSLLDAGFSAWSADKKEDFDSHQAYLNRDWQERMSNTSYQRAVQDLNAAGLSPMLAYSKGGASTPGGATASGAATASSDIAGGIQRSNQRALTAAQVEVAESQRDLNIQTAKQVAEQAKKTAIEVEQMPTRFYYDLANLGSQIDLNSSGAARTKVQTVNDQNLEAPGTGNPLIRDLKSGLRFLRDKTVNSAQNFWNNLKNPSDTMNRARQNLGR